MSESERERVRVSLFGEIEERLGLGAAIVVGGHEVRKERIEVREIRTEESSELEVS